MAYGDTTLSADHRWPFDGDALDAIGSLDFTTLTSIAYGTAITRDATQALFTNDRDDLASTSATDATTGSAGFDRFAFQGWFQASDIQGPPCLIFKTGGNNAGFSIFLWAGNNVMLQVKDINAAEDNLQFFSDIALTNNRSYHFFVRYSGSGYSDEIEFWLDGVKQTANRAGSAPGAASMTAHTGTILLGENGSAGTEVSVGDEAIIVKAPITGRWAEWWTWFGANAEAITETQINDDLFGAGAIPDFTISSDTEANMQTALDAIADTVRGDVPLAILVEAVTGDGDVTLTADNITFNPRASIHVRYEGTGTLTWVNNNGSDADRTSGNVTIANPSQLLIFNLKNPTEVRVYVAGTETELEGEENVTGGTFTRTISSPSVDIALISLDFQIKRIESVDMSSNVTINAFQLTDRQYRND